jgi:hypothetical protein
MQKSYWDSPYFVLRCLVDSKIVSNLENTVSDFEQVLTKGGNSTDFIKIKLKNPHEKQKKKIKFLYLNRATREILTQNPWSIPKCKQTDQTNKKVVDNAEKESKP